ncbi:hypothetical protein KIPB_011199, partial [Kipferlia bialata]|eukprot:g11199.t1
MQKAFIVCLIALMVFVAAETFDSYNGVEASCGVEEVCSSCKFDTKYHKCVGTCTYPKQCLQTSNTTCACSQCGWANQYL